MMRESFITLEGRKVTNKPLHKCGIVGGLYDASQIEVDGSLVDIPAHCDPLLVAIGLGRDEEIIRPNCAHLSGDELLSAVYAAMMCGHDSIANELSKYLAATVRSTDQDTEPVTYLCWALLCVGWCASSKDTALRLHKNDAPKKKKWNDKFKLQNFDQAHRIVRFASDRKQDYSSESSDASEESDVSDVSALANSFDKLYIRRSLDIDNTDGIYFETVADARHLQREQLEQPERVTWRQCDEDKRLSFNRYLDANCCGCWDIGEKQFTQAKRWKRVVDDAFGAEVQRVPRNPAYGDWQEWWVTECATRPSFESRLVLACEGPPGCSTLTLLRVLGALPPHPASALIKQRVLTMALNAFHDCHREFGYCGKQMKSLLAEPHWEIAAIEFTRLAHDLLHSQSTKWITSSVDVRATIVVMADLDVFIRPLAQIASETFKQRVSAIARLPRWPSQLPPIVLQRKVDMSHRYSVRIKAAQINRGLVFVSDCDPATFDLSDIPPTGLLPIHTLIAHRVKVEYGDVTMSGARGLPHRPPVSGRPFMANCSGGGSTIHLAEDQRCTQLTATVPAQSSTEKALDSWHEWPSQQPVDLEWDAAIAHDVCVSKCQELQAKWMHNALDEHASVAAFSKFVLELMAIGAPPYLLEWAHRASMQEIDHARLCATMAGAFAAAANAAGVSPPLPCEIGRLPDFRLTVKGSVKDIAASTMIEAAVGETSAALQLAIRLDASSGLGQHRLCSVLKQLMHDEASHGALAWATLQWMMENRDEDGEVSGAVSEALGVMGGKYGGKQHRRGLAGAVESVSIVENGFVRDEFVTYVDAVCFWDVIEPLTRKIIVMKSESIEWWELGTHTLVQALAPTSAELVVTELMSALRGWNTPSTSSLPVGSLVNG